MTDVLEGGVRLNELNLSQPVQDIVKDYEIKVHERAGDELNDTPREFMEPNREAESYARKGRLDVRTGFEIPPTSKTKAAQVKQFGRISDAYLRRYDLIAWD